MEHTKRERKWDRITIEEVEQALFGDGIPLQHWFTIGGVQRGYWSHGQVMICMDDDDAHDLACIRYLQSCAAPEYARGEDIPKSPAAPKTTSDGL